MRTYGDYRHPAVAWDGHGLGTLNDDSSTFLSLGFNSLQIQQIMSAHTSGALSDAGYQALVSGFISADQLSDFLAADPGAPTSSTSIPAPTLPGAQLAPGPSPRVPYTPSMTQWFTASTLIAGFPNWGVLAGGFVALTMLGGSVGGRRRR